MAATDLLASNPTAALGGIGAFISTYWFAFVGYMMIAFIVFFGIFFFWKFFIQYPIEVRIYSKRGGIAKDVNDKSIGRGLALRIYTDIGRVIDKDGYIKLRLFWRKKEKVVEQLNKYMYIRTGIFRKWMINLLEDDVGELHPITLSELGSIMELKPEIQQARGWAWLEKKNADDRWKNEDKWAKYAQILVPILFVVLTFVLMLILLYQIKDVSAALHEVATALSSVPRGVA